MFRLVAFTAVLLAIATASTPACDEYLKCLECARNISEKCTGSGHDFMCAKTPECEAANAEHEKLNQMLEDRNVQFDKCVRDAPVEELTGNKQGKCDKMLEKTKEKNDKSASGESEARVKRMAGKHHHNKSNAHKACLRESRAQRSRCAALAKCCPQAKSCNIATDTEFKQKIIAARPQLKTQIKACKAGQQKEKHDRKINARLLKQERRAKLADRKKKNDKKNKKEEGEEETAVTEETKDTKKPKEDKKTPETKEDKKAKKEQAKKEKKEKKEAKKQAKKDKKNKETPSSTTAAPEEETV